MKPLSKVLLALAAFLIVDAGVYMATAREWTGGPLIAATALTFSYVAWVLRGTTRRAAKEVAREQPSGNEAVELDHVGPTIWPACFSLSAIVLALGFAIATWLLALGAILFVASAVGWSLDVKRQHEHREPAGHAGDAAVSPGSAPPTP